MEADVAVVGGGAAGLVAAARAAEAAAREGRAARVVVLEAAREPGRKILVSGGGRCNVLPARDARERFVSASPRRLVDRFLDRFPLAHQRSLFEGLLGGALREEAETAKLFPPSNRARDVRLALVGWVAAAGARVVPSSPVRDLRVAAGGGSFELRLDGDLVRARRVVLSTGGLSVLPAGADAGGYGWAERMGHRVRPLYPALVPLTAASPSHAALAGVSLPARVVATSGEERAAASGGFLFTHRGYSGPAALDVSHVVARAVEAGRPIRVTVSFGGSGEEWDEGLRTGSGTAGSHLRRRLPDRLAELLLREARVPDGAPLHRLAREARRRLVEAVTALELTVTGTEGYRTAEVTGGGVALEEVDPGSGESRLVPGLFLAGEVLDAFGPIGGFNFQWAWATGSTAGAGAARSLTRGTAIP